VDTVLSIGQGTRAAALATVLAVALGLVTCGLLAARSPLGFGRVARSAMAGLPAGGAVVVAMVVALLIKPRIAPTSPVA
jgi:hypothetical protein